MGAPLISWLLLGFTMGVRHALEADHIAAVASLSARVTGPTELLRVVGAWGIGHALTIVTIALFWVATGVTVADGAEPLVEAAAGFLLIWLGFDLLRRRESGRARLHPHEHSDGTRHLHLHWHPSSPAGGGSCTPHPHVSHPVRRSLIVGSVHGLAGSALLGLLAAQGALPGQAIWFAVLFGVGATAGMLMLSTVASFPFRLQRVRAMASGRACQLTLASGSIAIGIWISGRAVFLLAPSVLGG